MIKELKRLISDGQTKTAINKLLDFVGGHYARFASTVIINSNRYNLVVEDYNSRRIPRTDYNLELNSINFALLQILNSIEDLEEKNFKKKKPKAEILETIMLLDGRYDKSRKRKKNIKSNASRLREKNEIARELGEIFVNHPELIKEFYHTESDGIITGIANRYKMIPEDACLDFFESILQNVTSNFTKCCIVNALLQYIYTGQFLVGDDKRIQDILVALYPNSYAPIRQNINRVYTELEYFTA